MNQKEMVKQLESLRDNSISFINEDDPGDIWIKDVIALDKAIRIIEGKRKLLKKATLVFTSITFFLALFYVIGRAGSLELDHITIGQAVTSCSIALVYMIIAAITYQILGKVE